MVMGYKVDRDTFLFIFAVSVVWCLQCLLLYIIPRRPNVFTN